MLRQNGGIYDKIINLLGSWLEDLLSCHNINIVVVDPAAAL